MKKYWLVFLSGSVALLPFLMLAAFNHPTDDDFCTYQLFHNRSSWEAFQYGYENFSGRYTYLLIFSQWDPLYQPNWIFFTRLWPLLTFIAFLVTLRVILSISLRSLAASDQWMLWTVLTVALLAGWPSVASSFYWFTGATVYTLALLCAGMSLVFLFISSQTSSLAKKAATFIMAALLALVAVGSNEVLLTFLVSFVFLLVVWNKVESASFSFPAFFLLLVVLGGAAIALTAPGNFKRASDMLHRSTEFSYALKVAIKCTYLVILKTGSWLTHVPLWLAALLMGAITTGVKFSWLAPRTRLHLGILALASFIIMVSMAFLSCYAYNDVIPRVWNLLYFFFVLTFCYLLTFALRLYPVFEPVLQLFRSQRIAVAFVTLAICLMSSSSNITIAWNDLLFKASEYDDRMVQRYERLREARQAGLEAVEVEPLFNNEYQYPGTLFLNDLRAEPGEFPNTCIGYFFGVKEIRLSGNPPRSRHLE